MLTKNLTKTFSMSTIIYKSIYYRISKPRFLSWFCNNFERYCVYYKLKSKKKRMYLDKMFQSYGTFWYVDCIVFFIYERERVFKKWRLEILGKKYRRGVRNIVLGICLTSMMFHLWEKIGLPFLKYLFNFE